MSQRMRTSQGRVNLQSAIDEISKRVTDIRDYADPMRTEMTEQQYHDRLAAANRLYLELIRALLYTMAADVRYADSCDASITGVRNGITFGMIAHVEILPDGAELTNWGVHT